MAPYPEKEKRLKVEHLESPRNDKKKSRPPLGVVLLAFLSLALVVVVLATGALLLAAPRSPLLHFSLHWLIRLGFIPMHGKIGTGQLPATGIVFTALMIYAVVFFLEGGGMLLGKAWAEYLVLVELALLLPPEMVENYRHTDWLRLLTLGFNVIIFIYLAVRRAQSLLRSRPGTAGV